MKYAFLLIKSLLFALAVTFKSVSFLRSKAKLFF